jgi:membrane fusion protein, heavy metal efflux system
MKRALLILLLLRGVAVAHEGEEHGNEASSGTAAADEGQRAVFGQTGRVEVLLKYAPPAPGARTSLKVFVSDFATNAPIDGAKIELELLGSPPVRAPAEPTGTPGIYHAVVTAPSATLPAIVTVSAGKLVELVEIAGVDLTSQVPAAATQAPVNVWPFVAAGLGLVALVAIGFALRKRRVVAGLFLLAVPADGPVRFPKESQFLLGVLTEVTAEREVQPRVETVGQVRPRVDGHAELHAPQAGRVVAVGGKLPVIGDPVKKGQQLLIIEQALGAAESGNLQAEALRARSAVADAKAERDQRRRDLERMQSLRGVVAEKEIQAAELALRLAEQDVSRAQAEVALFGGGQLQRTVVSSPIDGVVAEAHAAAGEVVRPEDPLLTILDPQVLWVEAEVFDTDLPRVEQAKAALVRIEGYEQPFPATLFRLGQVVSPTTRTTKAIFSVPNPDGRLRPGMFASIAIGVGPPRRLLTVPDAAVVEEGGRRFVFVKLAPEGFVRRELVLGAREGEHWQVTTGLAPGERVVTQGTYQLRTAR